MDLKYNKTSVKQINLITLKFDIINKFIKEYIKDNQNERSIKIMDIGCSHGYNSIIEASSIIKTIREDLKINKTIEVFHADQEINNFTELFLCVNNNNESYLNQNWDNIYVYAIGKNFKYLLSPQNTIDIIFSYFTLHWYDRNLFKNNDLFFISRLNNNQMEQYSKERLYEILLKRYTELKENGLLIINLVSTDSDEILFRFQESFKNVKQIFRDMANENILTHDEVNDMHIPILIFNSNIITNEINKIGFTILEKSQQIFDWCLPNDDENERTIQFVDSLLSFCGPSMKTSIKGDEDLKNKIFNQFINKFYNNYKSNPQLYNFKVDTLFLILKK